MPKVIDRYGTLNLVEQGAQLVDVLGAKEYEAEHLPRAINVPLKPSTVKPPSDSTPVGPSSSTATTTSET